MNFIIIILFTVQLWFTTNSHDDQPTPSGHICIDCRRGRGVTPISQADDSLKTCPSRLIELKVIIECTITNILSIWEYEEESPGQFKIPLWPGSGVFDFILVVSPAVPIEYVNVDFIFNHFY